MAEFCPPPPETLSTSITERVQEKVISESKDVSSIALSRSQFLHTPLITTPSTTPSIIYIKRDQLLPVPLLDPSTKTANGPPTLNTRFGAFPHANLVNIPYGSQVRAMPIGNKSGKRKRPANEENGTPGKDDLEEESKGFVHVLAPTPELWTSSLPHRTQVVYTPDSSYVLHRLRVRPGQTILEAGAGSGSFTHAAVRAIYGGSGKGRVISYEYHEQRARRLREEIRDHGLDGEVTIVDADVCEDGFAVDYSTEGAPKATKDGIYPDPHAIFLDLPSPHLAIPNIRPSRNHVVQLCTFSPCIEQVTKTHDVLHKLGWQAVEMVEISHKKVEVHYSPFNTDGSANTCAEALERLKELANVRKERILSSRDNDGGGQEKKPKNVQMTRPRRPTLKEILSLPEPVTTRFEPEVKTHTSYLTFAVLPMVWEEAEENAAKERVEREKGSYKQEVDKGWKKEQELNRKQKEEKAKRMEEQRKLKAEGKRRRRDRNGGNRSAEDETMEETEG